VPLGQSVTLVARWHSLGWDRLPASTQSPTISVTYSAGGRLGLEAEASDADVVRAVLAGDVDRYAVLVRRYRDRYARYAARMLGSRDVAEDAVQDALVRAFDRLADCRDPNKFAGWLFLILRNRCFAERRRRQRERPLGPGEDGLAAPDRPDGAYDQLERQTALERSLGHLTAEQREVFVLKHVEGMAYEEIAQITGATVASLKMRMHRAYDRLRDLMKGHL
jgi:RNA polymerase sigma-70 factor, ECF subfamily